MPPKKRPRSQSAKKLSSNLVNIKQECVIDDVQIKIEPIDNGCVDEATNVVLPTQIYTATDDNWASYEAETGFVSQLDIVKTEVDVDEATVKAFRDEMMRYHSQTDNEENATDEPSKKKRKTNVQEKKKKKTIEEKIVENSCGADLIEQSTSSSSSNQFNSAEMEPKPLETTVNGVIMVKCLFCDFQLTRRDRSLVKEHMRLHTGFMPHACIHCSEKFHTRSMLIRHMQADHRTKKMHKCPRCGVYSFTKKDFYAHEFNCVKLRSFQCHLCKIQMNRLYMYKVKDHMRRLHTGEQVFPCKHCTESFVSTHHLASHMQHHVDVMPFRCSLCKVRFATEEKWKKHEEHCLNKTSYQCHLCQYTHPTLTPDAMKMHMRKHTGEKPFQCKYCHKYYPRAEALSQHHQRHRELFDYKCSRCHRRFMDTNELMDHEAKCRKRRYECHLCGFTKYGLSYHSFRKHMAAKHFGQKSMECIGCTETFSSKNLLARHISDKHPNLLALVCPNCNHRFATRMARNHHFSQCLQRRHECYICKLTSKSLRTLRSHMVGKHTGEAKFKCHLCPRRYLLANNLQIHIRSHTKVGLVKCDYCKEKFSHIKFKKKHEFQCKKVYECYLCKKKFPSFVILHGMHMRTHLGQRPYSCAHCDKTFVSIRTYNLHVIGTHLNMYRFQCNECNEIIVVNKDVNKHKKFCLKPIRKAVGIVYFKCSLCGLGLARVPELRQHILQNECTNSCLRKKSIRN